MVVGRFKMVELEHFSQECREQFCKHQINATMYIKKTHLLDTVTEALRNRFRTVETHNVLQAAAKLVDAREWPTERKRPHQVGRYTNLIANTLTRKIETADTVSSEKQLKFDDLPAVR
ncbi:hypothetical protein AAFF_G00209260 [Aldrovandia affinis]|uniref:Uncharacterized protein n=1 Tax=Aldrovandia affinis TaxID=143900 RepID=A0AAD7SWA0_9TELE|nr:hypothetical protein AAFF_G00209260 [Aldrovandia affinis]